MTVESSESRISAAMKSLVKLGDVRPELADVLTKLATVLFEEAARNPRFSAALTDALSSESTTPKPPRSRRRTPGVFDPFEVFAAEGEEELRKRLSTLTLEQLRDIIAEHGMDHDRLAMKWKDPVRVIDRITEKVVGINRVQ